MISYVALISTLGMMCRKVLVNLVPNGIKMKVPPQVLVAFGTENKMMECQIIINIPSVTGILL